jgi:hypothetical protein
MDWQVSTANQFDYSREASGNKRIFGKSYTGIDGSNLANAFTCHADAMSYWNGSSEVDASAPSAGSIGISTDSVLGNRAHIKMRMYLHTAAVDGGYLQWNLVGKFSYTAAWIGLIAGPSFFKLVESFLSI